MPAGIHPPTPGRAPRWPLGDAVVHRIDEVALPGDTGSWLLPAATPELVAGAPWLRPDFVREDGSLLLAVHTFAVEIAGLRILIDTGLGNGKDRARPAWNRLDTPYLDRLRGAGFAPGSVDLVINTHLHADHVGWNTRRDDAGTWVPTFPRARYLVSRAESAYWSTADMDGDRRQIFTDSVDPVRDSGRFDLVDVPVEGAEVATGVTLFPAPGHTPGQVVVRLSSAGRTAVITGDSLHHPVQLWRPAVGSSLDADPAAAESTRHALLAELAGTDTLLFGTHFPPPTAGRVRADGTAYRLVPVPASDA